MSGAAITQLQQEHQQCSAEVARLIGEAEKLAAAEAELARAEQQLAEWRDEMVRLEAAQSARDAAARRGPPNALSSCSAG